MRFGLNSIKISIAGARLSHLVRENRMWDHGSMIEQVRTVFTHLKKAFLQYNPLIVKKCLTAKAYAKTEVEVASEKRKGIMNRELVSVEIISVLSSKHHQPDRFKALVKLRDETDEEDLAAPVNSQQRQGTVEEEWLFVREGSWWLLDEVKNQ